MQRRPVWGAFCFAERLPVGLSRVAEGFVTLKCDVRYPPEIRLYPDIAPCLKSADCVEKLENHGAPKISQM
jgi:hypothetical protein